LPEWPSGKLEGLELLAAHLGTAEGARLEPYVPRYLEAPLERERRADHAIAQAQAAREAVEAAAAEVAAVPRRARRQTAELDAKIRASTAINYDGTCQWTFGDLGADRKLPLTGDYCAEKMRALGAYLEGLGGVALSVEGWSFEAVVRASGACAGHVDKYYCEPLKGFDDDGVRKVRRHRSRTEVARHFGLLSSSVAPESAV